MATPKLCFSEFRDGGCVGEPTPHQYFITQTLDEKFYCHWSSAEFDTLEEAQAAAQAHYRELVS